VSGIGRILVIGVAIGGGFWPAAAAAQAVVGDPGNPAKTFASNCSACHKSPQGLAKSGNVAGFLRQHYTTGAAMSSAMASYLASVGNAPAAKPASPADARRRKDAPARTEAAERGETGDRQTERIADPHRTAAKQKTPNDTRASSRSRPTATAARPADPAPDAPSEAAPAAPAETPPAATAALGRPEPASAAPAPNAAAESAFPPPPAYPPPPPAILSPEPDQPAFSSAPLP
jgi:hypothetical protein